MNVNKCERMDVCPMLYVRWELGDFMRRLWRKNAWENGVDLARTLN